jgi:hypothetical protein
MTDLSSTSEEKAGISSAYHLFSMDTESDNILLFLDVLIYTKGKTWKLRFTDSLHTFGIYLLSESSHFHHTKKGAVLNLINKVDIFTRKSSI